VVIRKNWTAASSKRLMWGKFDAMAGRVIRGRHDDKSIKKPRTRFRVRQTSRGYTSLKNRHLTIPMKRVASQCP